MAEGREEESDGGVWQDSWRHARLTTPLLGTRIPATQQAAKNALSMARRSMVGKRYHFSNRQLSGRVWPCRPGAETPTPSP